jgi:hypothetical protein
MGRARPGPTTLSSGQRARARGPLRAGRTTGRTRLREAEALFAVGTRGPAKEALREAAAAASALDHCAPSLTSSRGARVSRPSLAARVSRTETSRRRVSSTYSRC